MMCLSALEGTACTYDSSDGWELGMLGRRIPKALADAGCLHACMVMGAPGSMFLSVLEDAPGEVILFKCSSYKSSIAVYGVLRAREKRFG